MTKHVYKIGDEFRLEPPYAAKYDLHGIYKAEAVHDGPMGQVIRFNGTKLAHGFALKPITQSDQPAPSIFERGVLDLISKITYKPGWSIWTGTDGDRVYVQLSVNAFAEASMDSVKRDGTRTPWKSAKRYLSPHMCRQELVGVIFGLIKDAELHEIHEWFRYKGASIYNPHLDPDALAALARKKTSFVVRENAMTMEEAA
ncbi:hypothetical protein [Rhizobium sp. 18065]|uniref:hypothetical protein n=1 Tax=Rhizobium sp. 18065 TaxID=2681411 RepID=UPI0013575FEA|nr:hypothetical protein [Rhizobium sp. 18065]